MAEGLLGGIVGDKDEEPEGESSEALDRAEAFAAAIAAKLAGNDPEVARDTSVFLKEQAELLRVQREHAKDEHALRLAHLRNQLREETVRRLGLRLRIAFQLVIALGAIALAVGAMIILRDAVSSQSVIVEAFDIAPNLSTQVPSGKIVAAGLLDVLTRIQAASRSNEGRSLSNAWTNEIAVEVPETGISIGQLERALKSRFGHDQHIDGNLTLTELGSFALTVRGNGILPKTFADAGRNLDKLLMECGEYVFSQSQPGLWVSYLTLNGRNDEAIRFAQNVYTEISPRERPGLLTDWANAITSVGGEGAMADALPLYRESVRLQPDYWVGYANIMYALSGLGDEEGAVQVARQMTRVAGGRPGRAPEDKYANYDQLVWDLPGLRAAFLGDMEAHRGNGTAGYVIGPQNLIVAQIDALMHDIEDSTLRIKTTTIDQESPPVVATAAMARALVAEERGELSAAAKEWDTFAAAYTNPSVRTPNPQLICYSAPVYEKTGQSQRADAALDGVTLHFVDCARFRGEVLDLRGDWAGAKKWYATAVQLGPSIPSGYYSWAMALAKHGDLPGAAIKFREAHERGPHWADPLKAWGDVLVKQGRAQEALIKYDEALKYAPNWATLKEAREAAMKRKT